MNGSCACAAPDPGDGWCRARLEPPTRRKTLSNGDPAEDSGLDGSGLDASVVPKPLLAVRLETSLRDL